MRKPTANIIILLFLTFLCGCDSDLVDFMMEQNQNTLKRTMLFTMFHMMNRDWAPVSDYITPQHRIVNSGTEIQFSLPAGITTSDPPYSYQWELLNRPSGSGSSLTSTTASTTFLTPDANGFYVIKLTLFRHGYEVGSDYAYIGTPTVVHYINDDATGANTGADWTNAWTSLPTTLTRGHTYYIADGTYPGYYCNTPSAGEIPIYIKKATGADHGTGTGWNTGTMGSGRATFYSPEPPNLSDPASLTPLTLNASHIVIDGQVGYGNGSVQQHGFRFYNAVAATTGIWQASFIIGDIIGIPASCRNIKIKHCEIAKPGCDNTQYHGRGLYISSMMSSLQYLLLNNCYIHDIPGISIYFINTQHSTVEYCYVARNHSDADYHGEGIQTGASCPFNTVRYNIWEDIEGTAVVVGDTGWRVYGNLSFYTPAYASSAPSGRHAPGVLCSNFVGMGFFTTIGGGTRSYCKVYNNTVVGNNTALTSDAGTLGVFIPGLGNVAYNNIFANCRRVRINAADADYNLFWNNIDDGSYSEAHFQILTANPFVDAANHNYHLSSDTNPGLTLDDLFGYDMDGDERGASGNWSRGAFQY